MTLIDPNPHLRPLITAALETGCREGELLSLQWHQIRFSARSRCDSGRFRCRRAFVFAPGKCISFKSHGMHAALKQFEQVRAARGNLVANSAGESDPPESGLARKPVQ